MLRCQQIISSLEPDEEFFDTQFGPIQVDQEENMDTQGRNCLYLNGEPINANYVHPDRIQWKFISDIVLDYEPQKGEKMKDGYCFFSQGAGTNDAKQGKLGDCWFIGALSVISTRDDLLCGFNQIPQPDPETSKVELTDQICDQMSMGVYPPIFHIYRKKGLYVFRFFKNFSWYYVLADTRLPVDRYSNKLIFSSCKNRREFWVPLIEKAFAKLHNSYGQLISGFINQGLNQMTGLPAHKEKLDLKDQKEANLMWVKIKRLLQGKTMLGCSVAGKTTTNEVTINDFQTGLYVNHAYSLLGAFIIDDSQHNKQIRLMRIRNPWGDSEWKGDWSDNSQQLKTYQDELDHYIQKLHRSERWQPGEEDGTFLMEYQDFLSIFTELYMCIQTKPGSYGYRYKCTWTKQNSFGIPTGSPEAPKNWAKNHQFLIEVKAKASILIQLQQPDGRMVSKNSFPFKDVINPICFTIMRLGEDDHQQKLSQYSSAKMVKMSTFTYQKMVSERITLNQGKYVIVPFTQKPGQLGKFFLTIFGEQIDSIKTTHVNGGGQKPSKAKKIFSDQEMKQDSLDRKKGQFSEARKTLIRERLNHLVELGDMEDQTGNIQGFRGQRQQGDDQFQDALDELDFVKKNRDDQEQEEEEEDENENSEDEDEL